MERTDMYTMELLQFNDQNGLKYEIWSNIKKYFLQEWGCDNNYKESSEDFKESSRDYSQEGIENE
jgi:hypothetical protein